MDKLSAQQRHTNMAAIRSKDTKPEYDYPAFHLTMHCYLCSLVTEALHLNEHEAAKWLAKDELGSVKWLPADVKVVEALRSKM